MIPFILGALAAVGLSELSKKNKPKMAGGGGVGEWKVNDVSKAKHLGIIEFQDNKGEWHNFEVMETNDRLVFGGFTNSGFIESGYIEKDGFSTDETLQELLSDLEVYYNDGAEYTSMIVVNERMAKGGGVGISHYKVGNELFIDYMDAVNYCDKNNLPYSKIIKTKQYAKGGGVGDIETKINNLYSKSSFINTDFNWRLKLLEMLQDRSVEAYNIYQSLNSEQKEEVLQEQYEIDNDMGSDGDGTLETTEENIKILLKDAKKGKKYAKGGEMADYTKTMGLVKVKFENPKYNYSTNVSGDITESEARKYFVGQVFDVGVYPKENMQVVKDIEFFSKGTYNENT